MHGETANRESARGIQTPAGAGIPEPSRALSDTRTPARYSSIPLPASITFVLPAIGAGGSEHVVTMLCNHLSNKGKAVRLVCFAAPDARPFHTLDSRVTLVCLGPPSPPPGRLAGALEAVRRYRALHNELRVTRPDLVVSFLTRTNVVAALAASRLAIPVIVSERNNPQYQTVGAVWQWLRNTSYRRAKALVTMTSGARRYFHPAVGRIDRVIPNHAHIDGPMADHSASGRQLVAVGRFVEQKGFDLLLEAFARVAARFPDWHLTIWGDGPLRPRLVALRHALLLDDRVTMPGVTSFPGGWVAGADLFVLSSRYEGWGLVVGEAMAGGVPVVSFDCPWGPGEMIDDGVSGLLVPAGDVDALAAALARTMNDPDLRERLGGAGHRAVQAFTPERILAQWDDLIAQVAGKPSKAAGEARP